MPIEKNARFMPKIGGDDILVSNTGLSTVLKCSTRAGLNYGLGLEEKTSGAAQTQGQAGHESMAEWLRTDGQQDKAMAAYRKAWAKMAAEPFEALPIDADDRERLSYARTAKILEEWYEARDIEDLPLRVEPADVEIPMAAKLVTLKDGRDVYYGAILDAIGKRRTGGLWSIDHKFRKSITDWWKGRQEDSAQFTGQMWLGEQWEMTFAGIYINGIEVTYRRTGKATCKEHGKPYFECDTKHAKHELFPVTRTPLEIAAWEETAKRAVRKLVKITDAVSELEDVRALPMEGRFNEACTFCGFRDWCRAGRPAGGRGDWFRERKPGPMALLAAEAA